MSILNDVIGPVMRGPSSSHTAGAFFIGKAVQEILGEKVASARIIFDPKGSFAQVYKHQCSDIGFVAGILGLSIRDEIFFSAISLAESKAIKITFEFQHIEISKHANAVIVEIVSDSNNRLCVAATSIGGGQIQLLQIDGIGVQHNGQQPKLFVIASHKTEASGQIQRITHKCRLEDIRIRENTFDTTNRSVLCEGKLASLKKLAKEVKGTTNFNVYLLPAVGLPVADKPSLRLNSVDDIFSGIECGDGTLAGLGHDYESELLDLPEEDVLKIMSERWQIMDASIQYGLSHTSGSGMSFLNSSAAKIAEAARSNMLICGGVLSYACAGALAVMEAGAAGNTLCAAPTAGSGGIIPGILFAVRQEKGLSESQIIEVLFAMGAIGLLVGSRATFAAEMCGCAVETGVAAAMAAAGLTELGGGSVQQALDAASLCLMNTLGLVCDPVNGKVEIPCHARNISGIGNTLAAADAVLGGFKAVLPLDEVIDCMQDVGLQIPSALRCTGCGGLAVTPTAHRLSRLNCGNRSRVF